MIESCLAYLLLYSMDTLLRTNYRKQYIFFMIHWNLGKTGNYDLSEMDIIMNTDSP